MLYHKIDHRDTIDQRVDDELNALPSALRSRLSRILEMIEQVGLEQVHEPHIKHLEDKLWEIRAKVLDGVARAIYISRQLGNDW